MRTNAVGHCQFIFQLIIPFFWRRKQQPRASGMTKDMDKVWEMSSRWAIRFWMGCRVSREHTGRQTRSELPLMEPWLAWIRGSAESLVSLLYCANLQERDISAMWALTDSRPRSHKAVVERNGNICCKGQDFPGRKFCLG